MSANLDRFSCGATPSEPIEVGECPGCGNIMLDYEVTMCPTCDSKVCEKCIETCDGEGCEQIGCRVCFTENEEGLLLCEECKNKEESEAENDNRSSKTEQE